MKRSALLLLGWLSLAANQSAAANAIIDDDAAAVRAAAVTSGHHLTSIKTECLYFDTADEGKRYLVRVREKHSKECGGDPETSNTVFFLRLRKRDGHTTTTAYNNEGVFQELRPAKDKPATATGH